MIHEYMPQCLELLEEYLTICHLTAFSQDDINLIKQNMADLKLLENQLKDIIVELNKNEETVELLIKARIILLAMKSIFLELTDAFTKVFQDLPEQSD